jgi:hypothetical protein
MRNASTKRKHQNKKCFNKAKNAKSRSQKIEHFNIVFQQNARRMQKSTAKEKNAKQFVKHKQNNKVQTRKHKQQNINH